MTIGEMATLAKELGYNVFSIFSDTTFNTPIIYEKSYEYVMFSPWTQKEVIKYQTFDNDISRKLFDMISPIQW